MNTTPACTCGSIVVNGTVRRIAPDASCKQHGDGNVTRARKIVATLVSMSDAELADFIARHDNAGTALDKLADDIAADETAADGAVADPDEAGDEFAAMERDDRFPME